MIMPGPVMAYHDSGSESGLLIYVFEIFISATVSSALYG